MACGRGSGKAMGKGQGRGTGENAILIIGVGLVVLFVLLGFTKFIVGLVYLKDCPAEERIPQYIAGSGCAASVLDGVSVCIETIGNAADGGLSAVLVVIEHFIGIIYGSVLVFRNYGYISGGCDGAEECCDQNFIKFALGALITEWIIIAILIVCVLGCFLCSVCE